MSKKGAPIGNQNARGHHAGGLVHSGFKSPSYQTPNFKAFAKDVRSPTSAFGHAFGGAFVGGGLGVATVIKSGLDAIDHTGIASGAVVGIGAGLGAGLAERYRQNKLKTKYGISTSQIKDYNQAFYAGKIKKGTYTK